MLRRRLRCCVCVSPPAAAVVLLSIDSIHTHNLPVSALLVLLYDKLDVRVLFVDTPVFCSKGQVLETRVAVGWRELQEPGFGGCHGNGAVRGKKLLLFSLQKLHPMMS